MSITTIPLKTNIIDSQGNTIDPATAQKKTAFSELLIAEPTPSVQIQFPYNINEEIIEKRENNLGSITQSQGMAVMASGATNNSAAHMLTRVPLKYDSGQGALVRFSTIFASGVNDSVQLAGVGEVGDGFFFGYNGTSFSVLRRELGKPEIQTLSITNSALGAGNITINLDSVAKTVTLTSDDTAREVAVKIADADFSDTGLGWSSFINNSTVIFKAWSDGDKTGTFSLVDTNSTGVVGSFAETVTGGATTNNWTPQTAWNFDTFDGNGFSGIILDPTKGNVYEIKYEWLGFGAIEFSVENPDTGEFCLAHQIAYSNSATTPSLQNPTLPLHVMSKNNANATNLEVKTSSMGGFVEGKDIFAGLHQSAEGKTTALATTEIPLVSIKNSVVYQNVINRVRMLLGFVRMATDGTKPVIFRLRKNPTLTGTPAFVDIDTSVSVASIDTSATGFTGGTVIDTFNLGKNDSEPVDLHALLFKLNPGDILTATAEATGGSGQEADASITWAELF